MNPNGRIERGEPMIAGKFFVFQPHGESLGKGRYTVLSRRGGFTVGRVEFRNQWQAWAFHPHSEAVFNKECLAELYAFLRDRKVPPPPPEPKWGWKIVEGVLTVWTPWFKPKKEQTP